MSTQAFAPVEALFLPLQTVSNIAADKAKKFASLQLSSLETYVSVGFNQAKAVVAVNSPEDFQALANKQTELFKLLSEKAVVDLQQFVLLGTEFGTEVQKLFEGKPAPAETTTVN